MSLASNHDPVMQDNPQLLEVVLSRYYFISTEPDSMIAPIHSGRVAHAHDSAGFKH